MKIVLLAVVVLVAAIVSVGLYHIEDDAFITFRYARHLAEGFGPVWNLNEAPVEGYTNFLWMLWVGLGIFLGENPVDWSTGWGVIFLMLNLVLFWHLIRSLVPSRWMQIGTFVVLASNYTLLAYGTSGLETAMNGALWTALILVTRKVPQVSSGTSFRLILWALVATLVLLSRLDGLILVMASAAYLWHHFHSSRKGLAPLVLAIAFLVLAIGAWEVWRIQFYGAVLPNTFAAKIGWPHLGDGIYYIGLFVANSLFFPVAIFLLPKYTRWAPLVSRFDLYLVSLLISWSLYMVYAGGDYMEFRMMVPVIPVFVVLLGRFADISYPSAWPAKAMLGMLLLANMGGGAMMRLGQPKRFVVPVRPEPYVQQKQFLSFAEQGKAILRLTGPDTTLVFASGNIGAYAYYNEFEWVDLYGLNDAWIARNGLARNWAPGHRILAPYSHLAKERKVNLVSVACYHRSDPKSSPPFHISDPATDRVLGEFEHIPGVPDPRMLVLGLNEDFKLLCLYINEHPRVEKLVAENQASTHPIAFEDK